MSTDPSDEELPYHYDPVCGDCGCLRTACMGVPPSGWDDLAPEEGCAHYDDNIGPPSSPTD